MVVFFEWHQTAVDQKNSGLPMTGEDTGLGALASPLAGYLGKVQERAASLEYCPWCNSKGLTYALRFYRINLHESITLCTNPQCLFPLVSRSLEDVLAGLHPVEQTSGNKRKNPVTLEKDELVQHSSKRSRSDDRCGVQTVSDTPLHQAEHCVVTNGQHAAQKADGEEVNGHHRDFACPAADGRWKSLEDENAPESENPACTEDVGHLQSSSKVMLTTNVDDGVLSSCGGALGVSEMEGDSREVENHPEVVNRCSGLAFNQPGPHAREGVYLAEINTPLSHHSDTSAWTEQKSLSPDITTCKDTASIKSESEDLSGTSLREAEELVSVPNQLFWKNRDNLCWLDSLLAALVNCKSLRKFIPKDEPHQASVWQLIRGYEDVCAAIRAHQQTGRGGIATVPDHVLQKANADLQTLRMSVFKQLQPQLHCKLGQRETPVFAMPLLLTMDSWVEPLFQLTFQWEFKCSKCKSATKERVMKTLPTFTNIVPEWNPLHAVHFAPCNRCRQKNQKRAMMLERVPPVFVLHFVEGLPDNNINIYTFNFEGRRYSITTVIQYNHQLKHFVTWICNSDGSWLEYDDLKHPECKTHPKLPIPAREMHVVFWEVEGDKDPACSPSSTFASSPPSKNEINPTLRGKDVGDELLPCTPDQSVVMSHNDTDIVCAFSGSEDGISIMDNTVTACADTSIGSTTLLDTFEGLSHNDIITLTLVELKADSEMQPLPDSEQTQDLPVPSKNEIADVTPDSSCAALDVEFGSSSTSTATESQDGSSSDPTFVPDARKRRGRGRGIGKAVGRQKNKKAASPKSAPCVSQPASSEPPAHQAATQDNTPPVETTQQTSPVSSTDTSRLSVSLTSENERWSFLLSKHPLNKVHKSISELAPIQTPTLVMQVKPTPPTHSTPNPVRRQQIPGELFPKPQLRTEESDGVPMKPAGMYDAFGAKSSQAPSPLPPPASPCNTPKLLQPITSYDQKSQMNTTVVSGTSLPAPGAKTLPGISLEKHSSQSSVPPGLSKTEALRYKLIKKLKAKKKKLKELNKLLGHQGEACLRPDSTDLSSPNTVTSSTYDGSISNDFLSDLLSPATTASNLSPDSTGLLEILANGQDGGDQIDYGIKAVGAPSQTDTCMGRPDADYFLRDIFSQSEMETQDLIELEMLMKL